MISPIFTAKLNDDYSVLDREIIYDFFERHNKRILNLYVDNDTVTLICASGVNGIIVTRKLEDNITNVIFSDNVPKTHRGKNGVSRCPVTTYDPLT